MRYQVERTFEGDAAPKSSWLTLCATGAFKDTIFQFISLFLLLFINYGTNLPLDKDYGTYFLVITIGLILIKTVGLFFASPLVAHLANVIKFKKLGNFRPWISIGSILSMVFFLLMFFNPLDGWLFVITFLLYYFLFEFFFCFNDIAYWGYFTTMSSNEKLKAKFGGYSSLFIAFGTYTLVSIVPAITGGHAAFALKLIALIIAILFILSSLLNTIVIKERKGDVVFKSSYKDTFKILKNNKYELPALFILFLFFAAVFILLGNSVNLFYYTYGYGNEAIYGSPLSSGGFTGVSFIFSLVYGVAITISQFLYPYINRKFSRKQILTFSVFAITVLYLLIYFFLSNRANVYLFFVAIFILAFFQGQINSIIIMINNLTIEYNDYLTGERRDKEIMAIRAAFGRSSGALQTGLFYLFLTLSGLTGLNNQIGNLEAQGIANSSFDVVGEVNKAIMATITGSDYDAKLMIFKIFVYLVPMFLFWILLFIYLKFYKLDEKEFTRIVTEIAIRNEKKTNP